MTRRLFGLLVPLLLCAGCRPTDYYTYPVDRGSGGHGRAVNPQVLRHVLSTPEVPLRRYYELGLQKREDSHSLSRLRKRAGELAGGGEPTADHYLQAGVDYLVPKIQSALRKHKRGGVKLICCKSIDSWRGELGIGRLGFARDRLFMNIIINDDARVIRIDWRDAYSSRQLTWDLAGIPGAFDPEAELSPALVARRIRPLHPEQRWYQ